MIVVDASAVAHALVVEPADGPVRDRFRAEHQLPGPRCHIDVVA